MTNPIAAEVRSLLANAKSLADTNTRLRHGSYSPGRDKAFAEMNAYRIVLGLIHVSDHAAEGSMEAYRTARLAALERLVGPLRACIDELAPDNEERRIAEAALAALF